MKNVGKTSLPGSKTSIDFLHFVRSREDAGDGDEVLEDQRGRKHGDVGGSGDVVRDRSRSPHHQRWRTDAEPDDGAPPPLRFNPRCTPGVQLPLNSGNPSPGKIFSYIFDSEVFRLITENTNKNAARNQEKGGKFTWTKMSQREAKKFIGLLLYMSVLDLPRMTDFWRQSTIFHVPFPATVMTRERFMAILSSLHFSDPEKDEENEQKKSTEDYDPLHQVRPLMEMIRTISKTIYHPKQHLSVVERMVGTKQCMKTKPTNRRFKLFVLADINGYTVDFKLYTGKSKTASGKGLSFDVVSSLVNRDYLGSGYLVYTDIYTSPVLFRHLSQQGIDGVPTTKENDLTKRSPPGSIRWIRDGDLLFVKWMGTREVSMCSTIHPMYSGDTVQRWQKTGIHIYTEGVDTSDQMIGTSAVRRKTRRWPIMVFHHLVDIAVTNSFVIHKTRCESLREKPLTRQQFLEEVAAHLLGVDLKSDLQKNPDQHLPVPTRSGQTKSQRASMGRRRCKVCSKSTPWKCWTCDVGLSANPGFGSTKKS
uniref:PiggyBac transposable element-derived protein domain-containing protein n=1 Tax=Oryzias melastigma TaxID=30732 RepID=A0A3B3BY38_ORYME